MKKLFIGESRQLFKYKSLHNLHRAFTEYGISIGKNSILGDEVHLYPFISIGDNVSIGAGTIIGSETTIHNGVKISNRVFITIPKENPEL